jgi:hypothetical protein
VFGTELRGGHDVFRLFDGIDLRDDDASAGVEGVTYGGVVMAWDAVWASLAL